MRLTGMDGESFFNKPSFKNAGLPEEIRRLPQG